MYLRSLELQGFKSFPDKIKLDFNRGLTAVVGPNGSGKSNIGDAVRWVLGEQSSKNLRGSKMEDVIFSGTELRKPVGFAQVTLNIDNAGHQLGIPAEEVSVTRKLYRSGDSEYLINGSQVRLKDVCELFMDTGLGRDGYSIIGQGRVAEIISAKSNERREIFEEAAGISKFRYKKAEAERNLTNAEDNILRLNDIIAELESRVGPLKIQSEKADQFLKLSQEKKSLEISFWINKLDELKVQLNNLNEKMLVNNSEYENIESDIVRIEEAIAQSYMSMQHSNVMIEEYQAQILDDEKQNGLINSEIAVLDNDISHENNAISEIRQNKENAKSSFADTEVKIKEEQDRIVELNSQTESVRSLSDSTKDELQNLSDQSLDFSKDYENVVAELNKLYIKQSECRFTINNTETAIKDAQERAVALTENENGARESLDNLEKEVRNADDGIKEIEEHFQEANNRISGLTRLFTNKNDKLNAVKQEFENKSRNLSEIVQKKKILEELERNLEGFSFSVKEILKSAKNQSISGIFGSVAQIIKIEDKYSVAIETALGANLQNIIVNNEETAKRCIRHLKENKSGRATFYPITTIKGNTLTEQGLSSEPGFVAVASDIVSCSSEFSGVIRYLLGRIVIAEDIDSASVIAKRYGFKFRIVTMDGQVINAGGSFTGGSVSRSSGVLTRKNEISELSAKIDKLSADIENNKSQIAKAQAEVDKLGIEIESQKDVINNINQDKIRFISEKKRVDALKEQLEGQLEGIISSRLNLKTRIAKYESTIKECDDALSECNNEIALKEKLVSDNSSKKDEMQSKREELSSKLSDFKVKETELLKDIEVSEQKISSLKENFENLALNDKNYDKQIADKEALIAEKLLLIDEKRNKITELITKTEEIKTKIANEQNNHRESEHSANINRNELKQKNDEKEKFTREITKLEERKVTINKDYDTIISDMWEQYNLTRSDAQKLYVDIADMPSAQKKLNELKSKIRAIGTVNLSAIEEYKEVSERYTFLSHQLNDVEVSKKELMSLISELTEEMKKRFADSFNEINSNFKSTFEELFGGGKAELVLTNPSDILESGIEINVAPPGKVIKNLSLLSGGEQSFVAIAIYFAILKVKPAPFCILDEIEAALDDINVTKYAKYLRNYTDTTQFILITHRRGTMEEADTLYGVTMQEKGISKLLKMDQTDVHSMVQTN